MRLGLLVVIALLGSVALGACGGGASEEELEKARAEGAQAERERAKIAEMEKEIKKLKRENRSGASGSGMSAGGAGSVSGGSGPVKVCQDNVSVGPDTTCEFAMNVAGEYGSNPGASTIRAYSPVTDQFYVMTCKPWNGTGTICTGGKGATVYIR
jgi:hypothetical protein